METLNAIELRCAHRLHGVVYLDDGDGTDGSVLEVRCPDCARREAGVTVTHRWRIQSAERLEDRREPKPVAA